MRYASSLLYGGMLVDAEKADYKDYARLLLRCPFCGEAVFLVAGKHRDEHARLSPKSRQIVLVKAAEVKPAFAHFPGVASQNCELRSTKINSSFIARCKTKSRNQRLKIFQNHFGKIFEDMEINNQALINIFRSVNPFLDKNHVEEIDRDFRKDFRRRITDKNNINQLNDVARETCEEMLKNPDDVLSLNDNRDTAVEWIESLEIDMHLQIISEVIDFLHTKTVYPFLDTLCYQGFDLWLRVFISNYGADELYNLFSLSKSFKGVKKDYDYVISKTISGTVVLLCGITWADFIKDVQEANA